MSAPDALAVFMTAKSAAMTLAFAGFAPEDGIEADRGLLAWAEGFVAWWEGSDAPFEEQENCPHYEVFEPAGYHRAKLLLDPTYRLDAVCGEAWGDERGPLFARAIRGGGL